MSREIDISPFSDSHLNPASYDLTLDPRIRLAIPYQRLDDVVDMRKVEPGYTEPYTMDDTGFFLRSQQFLLASTIERVTLGHQIGSRIEGKSSLGRVGLAVHITAGFFDPGWDGECTLEIYNFLPRPIIIYPGMRIAQMAFFRLDNSPLAGYEIKGHYQGQEGPTESRYEMRD